MISNTVKNPKVSVIITTYNRQETLSRAIQSVLDQTYQDFEIIVVDDASKVSQEEIVSSFNDDRIKFIRHSINKGGSAARNTGIAASLGEYIAFLDSDDQWLPDHLSCQIKSFENLPFTVGAHYSGLVIHSSEGEIVGRRVPFASGDQPFQGSTHDKVITI